MSQSDEAPRPPPTGWLEAVERGEADAVAGRTVPLSVVLDDLRASLTRMEAKEAHIQKAVAKA